MGYIVFKTVKKHKRLIIKQPTLVVEKYTSGAKKGKVKAKRRAQYCEGLDTIFIDEQSKLIDKPERTNIYVKNSFLKIDEDDVRMLELLRKHEDNVANGGNQFQEVNIEEEELYEIEQMEKTDEVRSLLAKASENEVITAGVWFFGIHYMEKKYSSIKLKLREGIDRSQAQNPKYKFRDELRQFLESKNNDIKLATVIALKENIISIKKGKDIVWADTQEHIFSSSQNKYVLKEFVNFLTNEEKGSAVLGHITGKLEEFLD